ncbi:MAG TPA: GNAT family N-acetyltransferase [Polyangia bacterium]|nr:GNAT family N-acetyltransferase [Polyangia bacterium]
MTDRPPLVARARAPVARAQAGWIAAMDPWRGLGYRAPALGRWLARVASQNSDEIWLARARMRGPVQGIVVVQGNFLLGSFIALLAVRSSAAGRGVGRALMAHIEARALASRRWLYVSFDRDNQAARRFYRRQGFVRVGALPDLLKPGRVEVLLRKGRPRV